MTHQNMSRRPSTKKRTTTRRPKIELSPEVRRQSHRVRGEPANVRNYLPTRKPSKKRASPKQSRSTYQAPHEIKLSPSKTAALMRSRRRKSSRRRVSGARSMGAVRSRKRLSVRSRGVSRSRLEKHQLLREISSVEKKLPPHSSSWKTDELVIERADVGRRASTHVKVRSAKR